MKIYLYGVAALSVLAVESVLLKHMNVVHGADMVETPATVVASVDSSPVEPGKYSRTVEANFHDVFADLEFAITEKNYRITGVNSIGRAIAERGDRDFPLASAVHFCNIEAAKKILEISMDYLLLMPCRITLNEVDNGLILIEARLLPLGDEKMIEAAQDINTLLREIVDFAAGDW